MKKLCLILLLMYAGHITPLSAELREYWLVNSTGTFKIFNGDGIIIKYLNSAWDSGMTITPEGVVISTGSLVLSSGDLNLLDGNLIINDNWISGDGDDEGLAVDSNGNVGIGRNDPQGILHILNDNGCTFYVSNTSCNVGIGTIDPEWQLHIKSDTLDSRILLESSSGSTELNFERGAYKNNLAVGSAGELTLFNSGTGFVWDIHQDGDMILRSGNLGIGNTNPQQVISAQKDQDLSSIIRIRNDNNSTLARAEFVASYGDYTGYTFFGANSPLYTGSGEFIGGRGTFGSVGNPGGLVIGTFDDEPIVFVQNNTGVLHIDDTGNVGIGTSAPVTKLQIDGNTLVNSFTIAETGLFFRSDQVGTGNYAQSIISYDHQAGNNDGLSINAIDGISFCTNAVTRTERMRISQAGNVGIGSISPEEKLVVNGNIKCDSISTNQELWKLFYSTTVTNTISSITIPDLDGDNDGIYCIYSVIVTSTTGTTKYLGLTFNNDTTFSYGTSGSSYIEIATVEASTQSFISINFNVYAKSGSSRAVIGNGHAHNTSDNTFFTANQASFWNNLIDNITEINISAVGILYLEPGTYIELWKKG